MRRMTQVFCVAALVLGSAIPWFLRAQTGGSSAEADEAAVRAVVEDYLSAEAPRLKQAFLPTMNLYTTDEKQALRTIPFAEYLQRVSANNKQKEHHSSIDFIDQTGNSAVAKATTIRPAIKVTDYLSLVRIEGKWQIVNKVFTVERQQAAQPNQNITTNQANAADQPCAAGDHHIFDFMTGSWRTSDPGNATSGPTAGESTVDSMLGGCVIHEHRNLSRDGKRLFDGDGYWG